MKVLFFVLTLLLAGMAVALPFFMDAVALYVFEGVIVLLIVGMIVLYRSIIGPMGALDRGIDLLKAQDFASRLVHVGYGPSDKIADTFNAMMLQLKNERLRVREQNHFLDLLADASPMGIVVFDYDRRIRSVNPAAARMLGVADPAGMHVSDIPGELASAMASVPPNSTETFRLGDNSMFRCSNLFFLDSGHQRPFMLVESLTKELLEAERTAYGKVIRTMVHEVNNTLAGVLPLIDTCAMISGDETMEAAARSCAERCTALSSFIGNFANVVKIGSPSLKILDINDFLLTLRPFLESLASGKDISVEFSLSDGMPQCEIDSVQFEQVIVNLVKNAVESIGENGSVVISTTDDPPMIVVADNGAGISEEAAGKLFSPFFSTKNTGQGIGLTLSAEILRAHGFEFSLSTSAEDGITRFVICLSKGCHVAAKK